MTLSRYSTESEFNSFMKSLPRTVANPTYEAPADFPVSAVSKEETVAHTAQHAEHGGSAH